MIVGLRHAGRPLPSLANPAKAVVAGALAALIMKYLASVGVPWPLALAVGGVLYLALLALTRAIPKDVLFVIIGAARKTGVGHG
jgi:hypothetical protein